MTRTDDTTPIALLEPEDERALGAALRAAWAPAELDAELNEMLIEAALEDPLAPPTEDELVQSERLRQALEGEGAHPDVDLARALAAAAAPRELGREPAERIAREAVKPERSNVILVAFGTVATVAVAAAAAIMLFVHPLDRAAAPATAMAPAATIPLAQSRSTAPLFNRQAFETQNATARIDRIAAARGRELRDNQYAMWGLR